MPLPINIHELLRGKSVEKDYMTRFYNLDAIIAVRALG
jgi:hypothetical protein